jgi:hypothetical protein
MTEGVNLPGCFLAGFVERLEEAAPVVIAFENASRRLPRLMTW